MSLTAIKDIFHSAEHSWCQLPYWKVQQEASIKTLLLKLFTLYLLFIILIYYLSCFQSVIMPMLILNEARHMNLRAQALPCWNAKAGWVSSSHTQGCAVLYLPLCELGELGHCQLHLALLGARGWCWGLRLNWLRGCPRTCDGFLPSGGRSCAGTRNCCWDRLTPDYLSHHLLGLTCKRRIWAKNNFQLFNRKHSKLPNHKLQWGVMVIRQVKQTLQFAHKFSLQTICVTEKCLQNILTTVACT